MGKRATGVVACSIGVVIVSGLVWYPLAETARAAPAAEAAEARPGTAVPTTNGQELVAPPVESILRDIEQIRAAVGTTPWEGTLLDEAESGEDGANAADGFRRSLLEHVAPGRSSATHFPAEPVPASTGSPALAASVAERALFLRSLRRRLDALAIDLEELGCLEQADTLRTVNHQLRGQSLGNTTR